MVNFYLFRYEDCFVYEIYPQSENPRLTEVAHLDYDEDNNPSAHLLLSGTVIFYDFHSDRIVYSGSGAIH